MIVVDRPRARKDSQTVEEDGDATMRSTKGPSLRTFLLLVVCPIFLMGSSKNGSLDIAFIVLDFLKATLQYKHLCGVSKVLRIVLTIRSLTTRMRNLSCVII